jgi:hypothetical protein
MLDLSEFEGRLAERVAEVIEQSPRQVTEESWPALAIRGGVRHR